MQSVQHTRPLRVTNFVKSAGLVVGLADVTWHHTVGHQRKTRTLERRLDICGQRNASCFGDAPRVNRQGVVELVRVGGVGCEKTRHVRGKGEILEPCRQ